MPKSVGNNIYVIIDAALKEMPDDFVIKPFLLDNKTEVKRMILTEYDEEKILKELAEEHEEHGGFRMLAELVGDGTITLAKAAQKAGMTIAEFKKRAAQLKKRAVKS